MQPVLNDEYGDFECKAQMTAKRTKSVKLLGDIAKYNMSNPGIIGSIKDKPFLKIIVRVMQTCLSLPWKSTLYSHVMLS